MLRKSLLLVALVSAVLLQNQVASTQAAQDIDEGFKCVTECANRYEKAKLNSRTEAERNEAYKVFDKCQKDCLKAGQK